MTQSFYFLVSESIDQKLAMSSRKARTGRERQVKDKVEAILWAILKYCVDCDSKGTQLPLH